MALNAEAASKVKFGDNWLIRLLLALNDQWITLSLRTL